MSEQKSKHISGYEILKAWQQENKKIALINNKDGFKFLIGDEQVPFVQNYKVNADPSGITLVFELRIPSELFSNEVGC